MPAEEDNNTDEQQPRIHVDEDWKKTVAEERERLREEVEEKRAQAAEAGQQLPEPSIQMFMAGLFTQTLVALGAIENPITGEREVNEPEAGYLIDTISMLQKKMEGNLTADEDNYVRTLLHDLRMRYVALSSGAADESEETPEAGETA